jgi:hypothetical protein
MARSAGAAVAPVFAAPLVVAPILAGGLPFVIAGGLKSAYDLLLWQRFRSLRAPEDRPTNGNGDGAAGSDRRGPGP